MTVIAEKDRDTIRDLLARELDAPVELLFFTRPRSPVYAPDRADIQSCAETGELLDELVSLAAARLILTVHDVAADGSAAAVTYNVTDVPTVAVRRGASSEANVRFIGLPGGYEFSTLIADIVDVSTGRTDLTDETRAAARAIAAPVHLQVFVTPT